MRRLLLALGLAGCTPWYEIHGPTAGLGIEYEADRGLSPRLTLGYTYDRYRAGLGYGFDGLLAWAPLNDRIDLLTHARGTFLMTAEVGPAVSLSASDGARWAVDAGIWATTALPTEQSCDTSGGETRPDCSHAEWMSGDRIHPAWVPALAIDGTFVFGGAHGPSYVAHADTLATLSTYWLLNGKRQRTDYVARPKPSPP